MFKNSPPPKRNTDKLLEIIVLEVLRAIYKLKAIIIKDQIYGKQTDFQNHLTITFFQFCLNKEIKETIIGEIDNCFSFKSAVTL